MFDYLENIRNKPRGAKKRIAFFTAFTFSGIVFIFWFVAIYPSFREQNAIDKKVKNLESSPISSITSIFSENFGKIKDQLSVVKELGQNFTKEATYYKASTTSSTTTAEVEVQNTASSIMGTEGELP